MRNIPRTRSIRADRRGQILQAAVDLFSQHGFHGTTTKRIAQRAAVNEAIIFRHFRSKEELYEAAASQKCGAAERSLIGAATRLANASRPMEVFRDIGEQMMRVCHQDPKGLRLLFFSALQNHEPSSKMFRGVVEEQCSALSGYIDAEISDGVFRNVEPTLAARAFLGMIWYELMRRELFNQKDGPEPAEVVSAYVDIWFRGVLENATTPF